MGIDRTLVVVAVIVSFVFFFSCSNDWGKEGATPRPQTAPQTQKALETSEKQRSVEESPAEKSDESGTQDNRPPVIKSARLLLDSSGPKDMMRVEFSAVDPDGDKVTLDYRWFRNNDLAGTGETFSDFKRGDTIEVIIRPFDELAYGNERTMKLEIDNTSPEIIESTEYSFDGKTYTKTIQAIDADGDEVTFELKNAPKGMSIHAATGRITWDVPEDFTGDATASVLVSDGNEGVTRYDFTVTVGPEPSQQ